jgi:hypothetical protein
MKTIIAAFLVLLSFGAGMALQYHRDHKRIVEISSLWRLKGPNIPGVSVSGLDPAGIAVWQCPAVVKGENTIFYAPVGYTEGLSDCTKIGTAKIVLQFQ